MSVRVKFNYNQPNLVVDENDKVIGFASHWNQHGLGECIVYYLDGSADSAIFEELRFLNGSDRARLYLNVKEV